MARGEHFSSFTEICYGEAEALWLAWHPEMPPEQTGSLKLASAWTDAAAPVVRREPATSKHESRSIVRKRLQLYADKTNLANLKVVKYDSCKASIKNFRYKKKEYAFDNVFNAD